MLALVTGGLHRLGAAIATRLAQAGYDLALHARCDGQPDRELATAIERHGRDWAIFPADLADPTALPALVPAVADRLGRAPDLLVNSAAIIEEGSWSALTADQLRRHLDINLAAPLLLTGAFAAGGGRAVVNLVDQRIVNPPVDQAAYTASKLALAGMTLAMARALAPRLRVCAVAPGLTLPTADYDMDQLERLAKLMPLERLARPADVAEAVAYLLRAEAVTGQTIFVDGGAHLEAYPRDFIHLARDG
jgi:NAD(P)-dependent dehydrogenase (short-subunit alcohol dehydrogenase family)